MRKLILALMLSVLLLGFGSAMAATSAIENLPGGAGVIYFQAGTGWETLVNIQSTTATLNMTVHVTIYDMNSAELINFEVPLTKLDNMGFTIAASGPGTCTLVPYSDGAFGGTGIPAGGTPMGCPGISGLAYGYITLVLDNITTPPVDPTTVGSWTRLNFVNPDLLIMRAALLRGMDAAFAVNATMLQGFANMMMITPALPRSIGLFEGVPAIAANDQFMNSNGADALCTIPVDWNNGVPTPGGFITSDDPSVGPDIDSWELYATDNSGTISAPDPIFLPVIMNIPLLIVDGVAAGGASCLRDGRHKVLGSANNPYWGRYNATPALTNSTLIMVFPASPGVAAGTADPRSTGAPPASVVIKAYNDAELAVSTEVHPLEVHRIIAGLPGFNIISNAGELQVETATPMYGWVYTESAGFADVYPLMREQVNVVFTNLNAANGGGLIPDPAGGTVSNVLTIP